MAREREAAEKALAETIAPTLGQMTEVTTKNFAVAA